MKCALELQTTAVRRAEEIRQAELNIAQQKENEIKEFTIKFCERVGTLLEEKAYAGRIPEVDFYIKHWYSEELRGREMLPTHKDYADKRLSFNPTGKKLDLKIMASWFKPYCFTVSYKEESVWQYGLGGRRVYHVYIKPNPDCLS